MTTFHVFSQDAQIFLKNGKQISAIINITSPYSISITDDLNQKKAIQSVEIDSFFVDKRKYLSVFGFKDGKLQSFFAQENIKGHFSLLSIGKSVDLVFLEKDSLALFFNDEIGLSKFRKRILLTKNIELIHLINSPDFRASFTDLSKIIKKLNNVLYPNEVVKVSKNGTKLGFYIQGGVSTTTILFEHIINLHYDNDYGYLEPNNDNHLGLFLQVNPTKRISYEVGVWGLKYVAKRLLYYTSGPINATDTLYFKEQRFSFPINIRYNINTKKNMFFVKAGPQINIERVLDSWIKTDVFNQRQEAIFNKNTPNFGYNIGLGFAKNVNKLSLAIEYRFSAVHLLDGTTNVGKSYSNGIFLNIGRIQK